MKTQKLSFNAISGVLSRSEMKKIMAGSNNDATCQALVKRGDGSGGTVVIENQTPGSAAGAPGMIHYCCSSCCTATWAYHSGC